MTIGFDLDEVFINTPPLIPKPIIARLYKKRDDGKLIYRIPNKYEQIFRQLTHLPLFRPPMRENFQILNDLICKKNKLYLISSRFRFLEKRTSHIIKEYNLNKIFNGMYFNYSNQQPHVFKSKIIRNLKLDYYIDDDLSLLKYVAKDNPGTKYFWLNHMEKEAPRLKNISSIKKLSEILPKMK